MFEFFFGWRKASKCKKLIKRVRCRLKLLKNKRGSIVRHLREDMVYLITNGYEQTAFNRAEQLIKDESIMTVYELLDSFCEFILSNLSYIRRHKNVPDDIKEAVSSLIFASARRGDLPELQLIRKLFGERYGQKFAMAAIELCPGNLVNDQIKEKLCINYVSEDEKHRLVDEITKNCTKSEVLALEYNSEWHQKQVDEKEEPDTLYAISYEPQFPDPNFYADSSLNGSPLAIIPYESTSHSYGDIDYKDSLSSNYHSHGRILENKEGIKNGGGSSSESLPQFSEDTIVYLDDIVELHSTAAMEENFQDQRVFKFKSHAVRKYSFEQSLDDENEWSERSKSSSSSNESGKRTRGRSVSRERRRMKNGEWISYYGQPLKINAAKKHKSQYYRQHMKSCIEVRSNILSCKCHYKLSSHERDDCSLEYPCYFCTNDDGEDRFEKEGRQPENLWHEYRDSSSIKLADEEIDRNTQKDIKYPNHVHPKLPDYDDIAAKFKALKKEHLERTLTPTAIVPSKTVENH